MGRPKRGFAVAMRVIKALISAWTAGCPSPKRHPSRLTTVTRDRPRNDHPGEMLPCQPRGRGSGTLTPYDSNSLGCVCTATVVAHGWRSDGTRETGDVRGVANGPAGGMTPWLGERGHLASSCQERGLSANERPFREVSEVTGRTFRAFSGLTVRQPTKRDGRETRKLLLLRSGVFCSGRC